MGNMEQKVNWYNKKFICLNEKIIKTKIHGIQEETQVRKITTIWLKEKINKGHQHDTMHVISKESKNKQWLD